MNVLVAGGRSPLVSVVIPCYKQAKFLPDAIESVLAQTYKNFEIIVVDDGSPDDTRRVVAAYPQVRCAPRENGGLSAARNTGLQVSRGKFVVFLDADDRLLPEALQYGLNCFHLHPESAFVFGHFRLVTEGGHPLKEFSQNNPGGDRYEAMLMHNYIGMHATVMYRRAIFDEVVGFDATYQSCEDYELYLRIARRHPVHSYSQVVAEYRRHGNAMSVEAPQMLRAAMRVLAAQWPQIRSNATLVRACRKGVRHMTRVLVKPCLEQLRSSSRQGHWRLAGRLLLNVLGYTLLYSASLLLYLRLTLHLHQLRNDTSNP